MSRANITIQIDSNARDIEFCVMEGLTLEPSQHFKFTNGHWEGKFENFPIGNDKDLDLLIIVRGNPNVQSDMTLLVNEEAKGIFKLFKPFNRNGFAQFNEEIKL